MIRPSGSITARTWNSPATPEPRDAGGSKRSPAVPWPTNSPSAMTCATNEPLVAQRASPSATVTLVVWSHEPLTTPLGATVISIGTSTRSVPSKNASNRPMYRPTGAATGPASSVRACDSVECASSRAEGAHPHVTTHAPSATMTAAAPRAARSVVVPQRLSTASLGVADSSIVSRSTTRTGTALTGSGRTANASSVLLTCPTRACLS